jgi:hypothetical protein
MDLLALLFPREKKFYKMIEEQVALVGEAVVDFDKLISQFHKLTPKKRKNYIAEICKKEREDDVLYTRMVRALKSTFITPMDREDIHQLVVTFDSIIDTLELLTLEFSVYNIKKIDKYFIEQTRVFYQAFALVKKTISSIRNEDQVEQYCLLVRKLEKEGDIIYIKALKELFSDSVEPVTIVKLRDLYDSMEEMIDGLNEVALIIENLAVKYS